MNSNIEYYYNDMLRWSFGFDNPNKAAVIFACLFPLTWILWSLAWKTKSSWMKWGSVALTSAIILLNIFCLFKTYSRGGVAAALLGGLYLFGKSVRFETGWLKNVPTGKLSIGGILALSMIGLFIWTGVGSRSVEPVTTGDTSVTNRLVLWKTGLEMAVDNPLGFGTGRSGESYVQWYQPLEMKTSYRTMVNSYLTFLVEQGWLLSAVALFVFLFFWFSSIPPQSESSHFETIAGLRASIVAFLICGIFSTVMEEPWLWPIPGICAAGLIFWCYKLRIRPSIFKLLQASFCGLVILGSLYVVGLAKRRSDFLARKCGLIDGSQTIIEISKKTPAAARTWIVVPDEKIIGNDAGKLLRQLVLQAGVRLKIQDESSPLPSNTSLLLVGDAMQMPSVSSNLAVIFLSPSVVTREEANQWIKSCTHLTILLPGIDEDGRSRFWQSCADKYKLDQQTVRKFDGVGLRIDWAWPDIIKIVKGVN